VPAIDTLSGSLRGDLRGCTREGAAGMLGVSGEAGRWTVQLDQRLAGSTQARVTVHSRLDAHALANSPIEGTASVRSRDIEATLRELAALGLPLPADLPGLSTGLTTLEARFGGTVAHPSVVADVDAQAVSVGGGRPLHLVGTVWCRPAIRAARSTLGHRTAWQHHSRPRDPRPGNDSRPGHVHVRISEIGQLTVAVPERWRPTGALAIEGTWTGTLDSVAASLSMSSDGIDLAGTKFSSLDGRLDVSRARLDVPALTLRQDGAATLDLSDISSSAPARARSRRADAG